MLYRSSSQLSLATKAAVEGAWNPLTPGLYPAYTF